MEIDFVKKKELKTSVATVKCKIKRLKIPVMILNFGPEPPIITENIVERIGAKIDKSKIHDLEGISTVPVESIGQELKEKLYSALKSKAEINNLSEKVKSHSESQRELEARYTAEIKLLKSEIKILKRKATLTQKASSINKDTILSFKAKVRELERANENLNSKEYTIEWQLKLIEANSRLQEIISKKDSEIAELSNPPPLPMNDSSQKLPGWVSDNLRPLVYNHGLKNKVMELDKSFARENILEALQELLPWDEMVLRSQTDILPDQSIYGQPANSENFLSREGVAKQLGGAEAEAEAVPLSQKMLLAPVTIPVITSFLMLLMVMYSILALLLIAVLWFVVKKCQNS
ncbi:hypothetical protein C1646_763851 [Rhizophagus diaphanus]|nr:hypothetical protein C1646_763851 [Rhizophagus diaphanus] [Rhizophagus sp. MUCL 43196]